MSKKIVTDKVVYVEPNMIEDYTSYSSTNHGQVYKSVDLEDMCVVVHPGRSIPADRRARRREPASRYCRASQGRRHH